MLQPGIPILPLNTSIKRASQGPCLVLGGAQLGLSYGINNKCGMPSEDDTVELIRFAIESGIRSFDTARAYGQSERRIGLVMSGKANDGIRIVTKLDPMDGCDVDTPRDDAVDAAEASVAASMRNLGVDHLDIFLLHRASHRTAWGGTIWNMLREKQLAGQIGRLGISVQTPDEAHAALSDPSVQHIQLPFNILDHRWHESGLIAMLVNRTDIRVHVRSSLLQGLLSGDAGTRWPRILALSPERLVSNLSDLARNVGCRGLLELAIQYVRAQNWVDGIVIGIENKIQLQQVLTAFEMPLLNEAHMTYLSMNRPVVPAALLNPASWLREA